MHRRTLTSLATIAALAMGSLGVAGTASAAKAGSPFHGAGKAQGVKKAQAKRVGGGDGLTVVPATVTVAELTGTPYDGEPGDATKGECQALADAAQAVHDYGEGHGMSADQINTTIGGILDAGVARGCVFTGGLE